MQADPHRPQRLYWNQLVELKVASVYIRLHRNRLARYDTLISTIRAVASSGGIAGWAIWHQFAFVWAVVIALSQVVDALKDVFPFSKRLKAAADLTVGLERLCIDAQFEWEALYAGRMDTHQITEACRRLQVAQLDAENRSFPSGFAPNERLLTLAKEETKAYFKTRYQVEVD
jgi:hypothetical protein